MKENENIEFSRRNATIGLIGLAVMVIPVPIISSLAGLAIIGYAVFRERRQNK